MRDKDLIRLGLRRLTILFLISVGFVWLVSEVAFQIQKEENDRPPKEVVLVIPLGAAEKVAAGERVTAIPEEMIFVRGDRLVVKNEDVVAHQLGPLWIPAGLSASMVLDQADKFAYSCSFQNTRYLGLTVREPTTWQTRLIALALAAPVTAVLLFLYSLLVLPLRRNMPKPISLGE
jgi:hypothetical protein